jgi:chromate transport protein ChrA
MVRRYLPAVLRYGILVNIGAAWLPFSYLDQTRPAPFVTLLTHTVTAAGALLVLCSILSLWRRSRWVDWPRVCAFQVLYIVGWTYWIQKLAWLVDHGTADPGRAWISLTVEIAFWTALLAYNFRYRRLTTPA